jgi:ribosomal protein S27AE
MEDSIMKCPKCGYSPLQKKVERVRPNPLITYADQYVVYRVCPRCSYKIESNEEA